MAQFKRLQRVLCRVEIPRNSHAPRVLAALIAVLEHILKKKWSLDPTDRDMIVMWHKVTYQDESGTHKLESSLVTEGRSGKDTAMARTVGLPLAMACELILKGETSKKGCILPVYPEYYQPILQKLQDWDIRFTEKAI